MSIVKHRGGKGAFARFPHEKEIKNPQVLCDVKELVESYGYDFVSFEGDKELIGINERMISTIQNT
ncbi:MAG: hypothetical protein ACLRI8_07935 [Agathobacter rectalis]